MRRDGDDGQAIKIACNLQLISYEIKEKNVTNKFFIEFYLLF